MRQSLGMPGHIRTELVRRIAADPTSTALLLAGPTALDLWPGVQRVAEVGGRVVVEATLSPSRSTAASVRAEPPRRTPTSYVCHFEWAGIGLPTTVGELVLSHAGGGAGELVTQAVLLLDSTGFTPTGLDQRGLQAMASGFLDNLASAAELRSSAA